MLYSQAGYPMSLFNTDDILTQMYDLFLVQQL